MTFSCFRQGSLRRFWGGAVLVAILSVPNLSHAQDTVAACIKASDQGQDLRDQGKLMEARDEFAICSRDVCPQQIRATCTDWLGSLGTHIPSLVIAARTPAGQDVTTGVLKVDGKVVEGAMGGFAFSVNPGKHTLHIEHPGDVDTSLEVVAREGEQRRLVQVTIGKVASEGAVAKSTMSDPQATSSGGPPLATWIAGGLGVVAAGVSVGFLVVTLGNKADYETNCTTQACRADAESSFNTSLLLTDLFGIAGAVGIGVGGLLWVLAPSKTPPAKASATWNVGLGGASAVFRF